MVPGFPLVQAFPQALSDCDPHVTPDILPTLLTTTGTVQSQVLLPNTPPLVGVTFHHRMVAVVIGPQFDLLEVSSTNALALTPGDF